MVARRRVCGRYRRMTGTGIGLDEQFDLNMRLGDVQTDTGTRNLEKDLSVILASFLDTVTAGQTVTERQREIVRAGITEALQIHEDVLRVQSVTFTGDVTDDTVEATVEVVVPSGVLSLTETN